MPLWLADACEMWLQSSMNYNKILAQVRSGRGVCVRMHTRTRACVEMSVSMQMCSPVRGEIVHQTVMREQGLSLHVEWVNLFFVLMLMSLVSSISRLIRIFFALMLFSQQLEKPGQSKRLFHLITLKDSFPLFFLVGWFLKKEPRYCRGQALGRQRMCNAKETDSNMPYT